MLTSIQSVAQKTISVDLGAGLYYNSLGNYMPDSVLTTSSSSLNSDYIERTYLNYGLCLGYYLKNKEKSFSKLELSIGHRYLKEYNHYFKQGQDSDYFDYYVNSTYQQLNTTLNILFGKRLSSEIVDLSLAAGPSFQRVGIGNQIIIQDIYGHTVINGDTYGNLDIYKSFGGGWGLGLTTQLGIKLKIKDNFHIGTNLRYYFTGLAFLENDYINDQLEIKNNSYYFRVSRLAPSISFTFKFGKSKD